MTAKQKRDTLMLGQKTIHLDEDDEGLASRIDIHFNFESALNTPKNIESPNATARNN